MKLTYKGEELNSPYTNAEALKRFGEQAPADSWLWYHIHKAVQPKDSVKTCAQLGDMFLLPLGYGLVRPRIRCHFLIRRFLIKLSAKGTLCLYSGLLNIEGMVNNKDPNGAREYVGCWVQGKFLPGSEGYGNSKRTVDPIEALFLQMLEAGPVEFLAKCSKDIGRCCYCDAALDDPRSLKMGYGPVCAKHWGLPWGDKRPDGSPIGRGEVVPSFATAYDDNAAAICAGVRENPRDEFAWTQLADWCEEVGLPRVEMPKPGVVIPRL